MRILVVIIVALAATPTFACMYDEDCESGAACVKGTGMYGACVGGKSNNPHDADTRKDVPTDNNGSIEDSCAKDDSCESGPDQ
jgi:hypothetical protein